MGLLRYYLMSRRLIGIFDIILYDNNNNNNNNNNWDDLYSAVRMGITKNKGMLHTN